MIKNYLRITLRNILRHRVYSFINISGLAVGLACFILIFLWVKDELSFDRIHHNSNSLYLIVIHAKSGDRELQGPTTPAEFGPAIKEAFPEIRDFTRFRFHARQILKYDEKVFYEDGGAIADPAFFQMFTFPLIQGDPRQALKDPFSIVLSESLAKKYFGNFSPLGKTMEFMERPFIVTGIMQDVPANSHLQFDFLCSYYLMEKVDISSLDWYSDNFYTYIQLAKGANPVSLQQRMTDFILSRAPLFKKFKAKWMLQPLSEIYLDARYADYAIIQGDRKYVLIFSLIALGILIIACINFMNLSTARSAQRAKEIGVRKVVGSNRLQLVKQFLGESVWLTLIASVFAVGIVLLTLPSVNTLIQKSLTLDLMDFHLILALTATIILTGLFAGSYPAFVLSAFKPAAVLKEKNLSGQKGSLFRTILVVFQFSLSTFLIIGTAVIYQQLSFLQNTKLGFHKENVVYLPVNETVG